ESVERRVGTKGNANQQSTCRTQSRMSVSQALEPHTASICRHTPKVGAVCGKAARTVLCGGRAMKRASLPLQRRAFITLLGGAAGWPLAARAQEGQRDKQIRIGFSAVPTAAMLRAFRDALREHGYVEGQNLSIADRWPQGSSEQISDIARELVRGKVDIIVACPPPPPLAAKAATATIPIVMVGVGDPVGTGLVRSLARPGGNITGFVNLAPDLSAKQAQLLVE